jgi:hypothetical protein
MLRQLIHRLRGKLAQALQAAGELPTGPDTAATAPIRIETTSGLGYSLVVDPDQ